MLRDRHLSALALQKPTPVELRARAVAPYRRLAPVVAMAAAALADMEQLA